MENKGLTKKRIIAYLIDILFVFLVTSLIIEIKYINPYYDKYMESMEKYSEALEEYNRDEITLNELEELHEEYYYKVNKYSASYNIVIVVVLVLYFVVFQKYNKGQTLGKKLAKIRVINNEDKDKVSVLQYLLRMIPIFYIYIGGVIPTIINTILVFVLNKNNYMDITMIVSYIFLMLSLVSFILMIRSKDKRGIQDKLANTKVVLVENT